jgi:putative resolvase
MDMQDLLTVTEACAILGIHPSTLRRAANAGKIKIVRTPGGRRRIPRSEVERLKTPTQETPTEA